MPAPEWKYNSNPNLAALHFYPQGKSGAPIPEPGEAVILTPDDDHPGQWIINAQGNPLESSIQSAMLARRGIVAFIEPGKWQSPNLDLAFAVIGDHPGAEVQQTMENVAAKRQNRAVTPAAAPTPAPQEPAAESPIQYVSLDPETRPWPGAGVYYSPSAQEENLDGADPQSPLMVSKEDAEDFAVRGETIPYAVNTGKPRVVSVGVQENSPLPRPARLFSVRRMAVRKEGRGKEALQPRLRPLQRQQPHRTV